MTVERSLAGVRHLCTEFRCHRHEIGVVVGSSRGYCVGAVYGETAPLNAD